MDVEKLITTQLELECIRINDRGYLEGFICANPDDIARLYVMHDGQQYYRYIRHNVPADMRQLFKMMSADILFNDHNRAKAILLEQHACTSMFVGKVYIAPEGITVDHTNITYKDSGNLCGIKIDDVIVSACSSVRENNHAAEAWVFTEEEHRGNGYASQVVKAWAHRIRKLGKLPFYSYAIDNIASQHVAQSAGMQWVFDIVAYE